MYRGRPQLGASNPYLANALRAGGMATIFDATALIWESYPKLASAATVTGAAGADTNGAAATLIGAGAITTPFYLSHISLGSDDNNRFSANLSIRDAGGGTVRRVVSYWGEDVGAGTNSFGHMVRNLLPYRAPASQGYEAVVGTDPGSSYVYAYLTVIKREPFVFPGITNLIAQTATAKVPSASQGTIATSGATAWAYGSYAQLTAGIGTPILITGLIISQTTGSNGFSFQVAFATGAGGAEIDFAVVAKPGCNGTSFQFGSYYNLAPFGVYLPANTRIAARSASNNTGINARAIVEYIPLPIN